MGAQSVYMTVNSTDKEVIKKEFRARQAEDEYEYGHNPYNGTFSTLSGIEISSRVFDNEDKAYEYVFENTNKWGNALAVTVKEENKEPYTIIGGWAAC